MRRHHRPVVARVRDLALGALGPPEGDREGGRRLADVAWQRFGAPLFVPSWQARNDGYVRGPSAVKDGERWLLWYDVDSLWGGCIGLATDP